MKKFSVVLMLFFSLFLVSCGKKEKELPNCPGGTCISDKSLADLYLGVYDITENNNFQMDIKVMFYDEVESSVKVEFDGNKSHYSEGDYEVFYERQRNNLTSYEKIDGKFIKKSGREPLDEKYNLFAKLDVNWFELNNGTYKLKEDSLEAASKLFEFELKIELKNILVKVENKKITEFNVVFEHDRDDYYIMMNLKDHGKVEIKLPEVK